MRSTRRVLTGLALLATFTFVAAACGDSGSKTSNTGGGATTTAGGSTQTTAAAATTAGSTETTASAATTAGGGGAAGKTVGMLYDITGRGDQSFNDAAGAGLDKAKADFGIKATESTPTGDADRADRLKLLVDQKNGLVIGVGFLWGDAITAGAKAAPDTNFAIVDSVVDLPNVASLTFAANQGSFLVGAAAAMKSKTGHVGFIGGVDQDLIKNFQAGFDAGAKFVNPSIKIDDKYITEPPDFTGFNDPAKAKEIASAMYQGGADVIYAAAGGSGLGMFQAAKDFSAKGTKVWGIGVDSDQYNLVGADLQPFVLTSMLKRVDVGVYSTIKDYVQGSFKAGVHVFDLKVDGVGYATTGGNIDDNKSKLDDLKQQIIDGKIVVPDKP